MSEHLFVSVNPFSGALHNAYVVPIGKRATVRVICTNRAETTLIRVTVTPGGGSDSPSHSIIHNAALAANSPITTAPIMLRAGDTIRVLSYSGEVNFHITGLLQDA